MLHTPKASNSIKKSQALYQTAHWSGCEY